MIEYGTDYYCDHGEPPGDCPHGCGSGGSDPGDVVTLADVKPERVSWLWHSRLPAGKLVILDGDPGVGKSTLTLDMAARVSTGAPWPDGADCPAGDVLILSAEDGLADTIRPRLDAAGADVARVHALTEVSYQDDHGERASRPPVLPTDLVTVETIIGRLGVRLLIVDVLMAYLSGDVNSHRDQDVRRALHRMAALAERTGCCVLVLRHLSKGGGANAIYRGGGSIGIIGAARTALLAATDPEDEDEHKRVLAVTKTNIAAMPPALAYRLAPDELHGCARVQWLGESGHRAGDLLVTPEPSEERSERDEAREWLIAYLTDNGGEARARDVFKAARADGIAEATLKRARHRAGITAERRGFGQGSVWTLDPFSSHSAHSEQGSDPDPNEPNGDPNGWPADSLGAETNAEAQT